MTLVETFANEMEGDFRSAMDAILQSISPERPNWWHPYELRGVYEWRGIRFRHFFCIAGSVLFGAPTLVGCGEEVTVSADEFTAVRPAV
jgi:hypothetical protein